jgi:hypothetical protein
MTDANQSTTRPIVIFDTTLRDGEQSPGASMNLAEKMEVAQALVELGVDVIEAGFPIASPGDFEAVREIARNIRGSIICGLARCREADIDRAWEAVRHAQRARIHVFLATSAIHREHKLRMDKDEVIERAVASVKQAVGYCSDVEFSPEDASRTASKSPGEAMGKPASITSTPKSTSAWATSSFSARFILAPGDCSPSRSVVSKITIGRRVDWSLSDIWMHSWKRGCLDGG